MIFMVSVGILAQGVSGVTGIVADTTGAVIPGAQVVLLDTKTSRELTTTTNDQGVYVFSNVPPGAGYRLTITAPNFQTLVLNDVGLGVSRTETHDVRLTAGQVSETVTVTTQAGEATLNTTDATVGNVISEKQIRELPIQIRDNPAALLGLQPGVIGDNVGTGNINRVGSVAGARADQTNITVDGIDSNDVTTGQAFVTVGNLPIESVQEFRTTTANPNASQGRSSGGQVEMVSRSGTNEFHGSLREYYRGAKFAANTFFNNRAGIARPGLERHQFGGSLGGPLPFPNFGEGGPVFSSGRDKLFFFFDYEGRRDNSESSVARTVPLNHLREGRIAYIRATSTTTGAPCPATTRLNSNPDCVAFASPETIKSLDPLGIGFNQPLLQFINSRYPVANDLTGGNGLNTGLFRFNAPFTLEYNTYTTRIDGNISSNQRAFGRLQITRNSSTNGAAAVALFPGDPDQERLDDKSYQFVVGHNWVVTPSLTNQATVGISNQKWFFPVPEAGGFPVNYISLGLTTGGASLFTSPFADARYQDRDVMVPTIRDDMTWTKGNHTLQFGVSYKPIRQKTSLQDSFEYQFLGLGGGLTNLGPGPGAGTSLLFRPSNIRTSGTAGLNDWDATFVFALGRLSEIDTKYLYDPSGNVLPLGTTGKRDWVYNEYEAYVQDNWRILNNLTLNLGLRWQFYPAPYEKSGFQTVTDVTLEELIDARVASAAAGVRGVGAAPILSYTLGGKANNGAPLYESDWNNFSPRIGFNWNPSFKSGILGTIIGERKTAIRGGFSLLYDRPGGAITFVQDQNNYLLDQFPFQEFGSSFDIGTNLRNDPRFVAINALPFPNPVPVITNPATPNFENGVLTGLASGDNNYTSNRNFKIPESLQWSFGIQRELPGNMILDVSYVGRRGRKLFALTDASQVLNFKDAASGQFMLESFNAIQSQLEAGVPVGQLVSNPWIENQIGAAALANYGAKCNQFGLGANCAQVAVNLTGNLAVEGGTADFLQVLHSFDLLLPNVGMHSQFATGAYVSNLGKSQYDAMLVSLRKRFSSGFQFDVNYTWSHTLDNSSSVFNVTSGSNAGSNFICDVTNPDACWADSDFDIRHLVNVNAIWEIPVGRGRAFGTDMPKWLDAIIGGWTIAGIFASRTGLPTQSETGVFPVGFVIESPAAFTGDPLLLTPQIHDTPQGIQYFADPEGLMAALRFPRHGETGRRNAFRSEGYWKLDTVVTKKWRMPWSENHLLTFRAEAYNVTNSNFFSAPSFDISSPTTFGLVTASQSVPRVIQFALRYDF
jgi:hypothetical protein